MMDSKASWNSESQFLDDEIFVDQDQTQSGGFIDLSTSHFTRLGLPRQNEYTSSSSSADSVIHIDVSQVKF